MTSTAEATLEKDVDLGGVKVYRWGRLIISPGLTDKMLCQLYLAWEAEGTLPVIFHQKGGVPSLLDFMLEYLDPKQATLGCWRQNEAGTWELVGCMWVNHFFEIGAGFRRADVGMGFLREHTVGAQAVRFAQLGIEWSFDHLDVEVLGGMTPANNRAAVIFSRKLGFDVCGPIPAAVSWKGELAEGYLSTMTKQRWAEVRPWKE